MPNSQEIKPAKSIKPGTIWQLGDHRLAYGDCRDKKILDRLIGNEKIKLIAVDPPYAVGAVESKRGFRTLAKDKEIANDHLQTHAEYQAFTRSWLEAIAPHLAKKNAAYVFNSDKMIWSLREGMVDAGFKAAQLLIWIKSQPVIGRMDYSPQHELLLYGWYGTHAFRRSKDKSVLFCPRPSRSPFHPTTKPISLVRRLILNSTEIGDAVYDGFVGSGTCILACEETKRKCFAVEIDLEYCLTVISRFEKLTGIQAKKL